MAGKRPFLSISLLSSGRIETIERCLASLLPFKERFATEIIIIDTDSGHRADVREVLEKYADRIIPFDWCDDFAAARNVGVDAARGEWFLYIDDDEWFIDAEPLIDFLASPEEKGCKWTNLRLRNYKDAELTRFSDTWISRLFRMDLGFRFVGRMHEYPQPISGKALNIEGLLGHTGYVYANDEERIAHARRNIRGLEALMKEEPDEVRWVVQAMGEYEDLKDTKKVLSLAKKGYRIMSGYPGYHAAMIRGYFAANQVRIPAFEEAWQRALNAYKRLTAGEQLGKMSQAQMELDAARSAYSIGKRSLAKKHCRKYLDLYGGMAGKPVEEADEYLGFQADTLKDANHDYIAAMLMYLDMSDGKWDSFDEFFDTVKWDGSGGYGTGQYKRNLLMGTFRLTYNGRFFKMAGVFWGTAEGREIIQTIVRDGTRQGAADANDPSFWNLVRAVAEADITEHIPWDLLILWADRAAEENGIRGILSTDGAVSHAMDNGDGKKAVDADVDGQIGGIATVGKEALQKYFRRLFEIINPLLIDPKLWEIGIKRGAVLDERIKEIPMERWQVCVEEFIQKADAGFALRVAAVLEEVYLGLPDEHYQYFLARSADMIAKAEKTAERAAEAQKRKESQESAQKEMKEIIDALQGKVDELVSAGMIEEADEVLREIQKYTDMM